MTIHFGHLACAGLIVGALVFSEAPLSAMPINGLAETVTPTAGLTVRPDKARLICYSYGRCYRTYGYRHYGYRHYGYGYRPYGYRHYGYGYNAYPRLGLGFGFY